MSLIVKSCAISAGLPGVKFVPNTFRFTLNDEQWELQYEHLPDGYHIEVIPLNEQARHTRWPYNRAVKHDNRGTISMAECNILCHVCGSKVKGHDNFRGDYYYCSFCREHYEASPTVCLVCGHKLTTDWDGPYCINCSRHYYKVKKPPTTA